MTRNELGILRQLCKQWDKVAKDGMQDNYVAETLHSCAEDLKDILDELEKGIKDGL
jgi:hypothetical protein